MPALVRWLRGRRPTRRAPSWSRIAPRLFIGPALDRVGYFELAQQGVTHVVDLRAEGSDDSDPAESVGLRWVGLPIVDRYPPTDEQFEQLADWLDTSVPYPVVYIHCQGGLERSPTVAIGLLMRAGYELHEARAAVLSAHPHARPTPAQEDWLNQLQASSSQPGATTGLVDTRRYTHRPNSNRKRGET
jgi:protein-tyrosine phosphatase